MSILIKNVILDGKKRDIFIDGNKIKKIAPKLNLKVQDKIDCRGEKAILPGFINCHTHAAMTLFRGYGDDLPLKEWLEKKIWPLEAKLTQDDVYWGTKLACLEMIKTGTTCFNDMYWHSDAAALAAEEMGLRARAGFLIIDFDKRGSAENAQKIYHNLQSQKLKTASFALAPHSIYAVSEKNLIWSSNFAKKNNLILHIHISETEEEVKDCLKKFKIRPVEYLGKIGFLSENVVLTHGVWLSDKEIETLRKKKCSVVYNPCSNLKLASGIMPYQKLKEAGVNTCLGTDGAASNNNLDMLEEMKIGALIQKYKENDPMAASAKDIFNSATINGARALKIYAGEVKERKLADLVLIDLVKTTFFSPGHNFISDIVYSGESSAVSDLICDGKILMRNYSVDGEREILKKTAIRAKKLIKKPS